MWVLVRGDSLLEEGQGAGGAVFNAFLGDLLEAVLDGLVEGSGDADIESPADEGEAERFAGHFGEFHADAAQDAFARLEHDAAGLKLLLEGPALGAETVGVGAIGLGVMLEDTVAGGPAVAVHAARRFGDGFLAVVAGAAVARADSGAFAGGAQEIAQLARAEASHDAGEDFLGPASGLAIQEAVNALGSSAAVGHGADQLFGGLHGGTGGEDLRNLRLAGVGVGGDQGSAHWQAERQVLARLDLANGEQDSVKRTRHALQRKLFSESDAEFEFDAEASQQVDFGVQHLGRQGLGGNVAQGTPGFGVAIDHGDRVALTSEAPGSGQAGGAGANDDN